MLQFIIVQLTSATTAVSHYCINSYLERGLAVASSCSWTQPV